MADHAPGGGDGHDDSRAADVGLANDASSNSWEQSTEHSASFDEGAQNTLVLDEVEERGGTKARDLLLEEREDIQRFNKLRRRAQFWYYEPAADRMMPMLEQEAASIPRPGSAVTYAIGSHQYKMSEEEQKRLLEVFCTFDMDGNDVIDVRELASIFKNLDVDPDPDQLELLMREYDEDASGEMQFEEFVPLYMEIVEGQQNRALVETAVEEGALVFARDSHGSIRQAQVVQVKTTKVQTEEEPDPAQDEDERPPRTTSTFVIEFAGGARATLPRRGIYTRQELNPPQSSVNMADILPPTRDVRPPTFNELQEKGVPAANMMQYVHFTYRHAYGVEQSYPVLRRCFYPTKSVRLTKEDVSALVEEDWDYLHNTLSSTLETVMQEAEEVNAMYGVLVRLATRVPVDQPVNSICVLSQADKRESEAENDVRIFVTRQRRGLPLPPKVAARHGVEENHVPTRKDVAAAKKHLKTVSQEAMDLRRAVGKRRLQKYRRVPKDPAEEVKELGAERDRLIEEFEIKVEMEKERLSLIDQMHSGPKQTEARKKAKAQLKYLQSSIQDAKEVFQARIQAAINKDPDLEEGILAQDAETEDIERLINHIGRDFEQGVQAEIRFREEVVRKTAIRSVVRKRMSKMTVATQKISDAELDVFADVIQGAYRYKKARRRFLEAAKFWTYNKGNVMLQGPSHPFTKNCVLSRGVPIFGFYAGHSVTVEVEDGTVETRVISRYTDHREVQVRSAFSLPPMLGGRFALRPPDDLITVQAMFLDAFHLQDTEGSRDLDAPKLRKAFQTNGYIFNDPETDKLVDVYGKREAGYVDFDEYKVLLTGKEFKDRAQVTFQASKETDATRAFFRAVNDYVCENEGEWDKIKQDEDILTYARLALFEEEDWQTNFLGAPPIKPVDQFLEAHYVEEVEEIPPPEEETFDWDIAPTLDTGEAGGGQALPRRASSVPAEDVDSFHSLKLQDPKARFRKNLLSSRPVGSFFARDMARPPTSSARNFGSFVGRSPLAGGAGMDGHVVQASPVGTFVKRSGQIASTASSAPLARRSASPGYTSPRVRSLEAAPPVSPSRSASSSFVGMFSGAAADPTESFAFRTVVNSSMTSATPQRKEVKIAAFLGDGDVEEGLSHLTGAVRTSQVRLLPDDEALPQAVDAHSDVEVDSETDQERIQHALNDLKLDEGAHVETGSERPSHHVQISGDNFGRGVFSAIKDTISDLVGKNDMGHEMAEEADAEAQRVRVRNRRTNVALEQKNIGQDAERANRRRVSIQAFGDFNSKLRLQKANSRQHASKEHAAAASKLLRGEKVDESSGLANLARRRRSSILRNSVDITWPFFGVMKDFDGEVRRLSPFLANAEIKNIDDVSGKIAVAEGGECSLVLKARNAQNAGAVGLIILCKDEDFLRELKDYAHLADQQMVDHPDAPASKHASKRRHTATNRLKKAQVKFKRMQLVGQRTDLEFVEEDQNIPAYERRSAIRIPVLLVEIHEGPRFTNGSHVTISLYDRLQSHELAIWPYSNIREDQVEYEVRQDFSCMSNVLVRVMHGVSGKMLPVGIKPEDPATWTEEQLLAALKQVDWVPRPHLEYTVEDLVRLAKQMKCKPPEKASRQIFKVSILEAQHLPMLDVQVKSASFVKTEKRSKTIKESQDPVWKDDFKFTIVEDDIRKRELHKVKVLFDEVASEGILDFAGFKKVIKAYPNLIPRDDDEKLQELLYEYDANKNGSIEWEELVTLFDATAMDIKDLLFTIYDEAIGGLEHEIGTAKVSVEGLRSGERRALTLTLKDREGMVVLGHDARTSMLKIRVSMHNVSSVREFETADKEALRILEGSSRVRQDLQSCHLLGADLYPMHLSDSNTMRGLASLSAQVSLNHDALAVTAFDPSIPKLPHREFRAFVYDSVMTAVTQRHNNMYLAELADADIRNNFRHVIVSNFYTEIVMEMEDATFFNYILDIYIPPPKNERAPERVMVLSVKPFHESTDGILYDWNDLEDREILYNGAILPEGEAQHVTLETGRLVNNIELRYISEPRPDPLGALPSLWADSLKDILNDMELDDPLQDQGDNQQYEDEEGAFNLVKAAVAESKTCCIL